MAASFSFSNTYKAGIADCVPTGVVSDGNDLSYVGVFNTGTTTHLNANTVTPSLSLSKDSYLTVIADTGEVSTVNSLYWLGQSIINSRAFMSTVTYGCSALVTTFIPGSGQPESLIEYSVNGVDWLNAPVQDVGGVQYWNPGNNYDSSASIAPTRLETPFIARYIRASSRAVLSQQLTNVQTGVFLGADITLAVSTICYTMRVNAVPFVPTSDDCVPTIGSTRNCLAAITSVRNCL